MPVTSSGSGTATSSPTQVLNPCVQRSSVMNGSTVYSCVPVSVSNPLPVTTGGGTGPPAAPVVSTGNFSASLPLTNGQTIGTMAASGSPTGWAITSCSASCTGYFAISSSGVITVTPTGASGATPTTYVVGVQATNAGGNGSGTANVTVNALANLPFALPTGDVLHYADPAGSDSNDGLAPVVGGGHGPWAIATNHNLNCGDVIIAAAGSYPQQGPSGTVSNCPSNSGGIDGTGGIWFATVLCGSASVGDCYMTTKLPITAITDAVFINSSNWAMEGFYCNPSLATGAGGVPKGRCYESNGSSVIHHVAFINDISADSLQAADTDDNGNTGAVGVDYFAVLGMIAQNSAQDPICLAAIDVVSPGVSDTLPGTHFYVNGNFSFNHQAPPGNPTCSDVEAYMADSPGNHNSLAQEVWSNNVGYRANRMCFQALQSGSETTTIKVYGNTCFNDNVNSQGDNANGEIQVQTFGANIALNLTVQNNLTFQPALSSAGGGGHVYAFLLGRPLAGSNVTVGGGGQQNVFRAANDTPSTGLGCTGLSGSPSFCNATFDAATFGGVLGDLGTNIYPGTPGGVGPAFTNTADLLANRQGVPNCSGFENVTQCMGWNAVTGVLTTPSVISDLVPTASGTAGKGYQMPSINCVTTGPIVADYPVWLKGIVYLHWNGTSLSENSGLVTRPCGM